MLSTKLKEAAGNGADATLYVDDVFSTYLYTGNGSTQTITNGIDLAGKGGMTWIKSRSAVADHKLTDTVRGATKALISNTTGAETTDTTGLTAFSSTGFSLGASSVYNTNAATYASWTFRKAAKFFDVVTYTGTGSARTIAHSLGVAPGMIIVKPTSVSGDWYVYHQSLGNTQYLYLNNTTASGTGTIWNNTSPTSTQFTINGSGAVNQLGATYVAYLFAHDTSSTGIIQCGSYTGNGSATGPTVSLGWEPQYLMVKNASGTGNWQILDSMRGMPVGSADATLQANLSNTESSVEYLSPTATGFKITSTSTEVNTSGATYIYMAIRRPNKPPTSGTQVFAPVAQLGDMFVTTNFPVDSMWSAWRNLSGYASNFADRLRGGGNYLDSRSSAAEDVNATQYLKFDYNTGVDDNLFNPSFQRAYWNFKRAPGFFDEVCYTGTGVATTQAHNLTVVPELTIIKNRSDVTNWIVWNAINAGDNYTMLNSTAANSSLGGAGFTSPPTKTILSLGTAPAVNQSSNLFVAYLFATLAGISKVGSYTGNGSSLNIECGFAAGARFVLIKCTSAVGDWYVWDTARGIVSANDPHLSLNTTAAEVTTDDSVDPYLAGFAVNQIAATNINVSSATYIFLAIA